MHFLFFNAACLVAYRHVANRPQITNMGDDTDQYEYDRLLMNRYCSVLLVFDAFMMLVSFDTHITLLSSWESKTVPTAKHNQHRPLDVNHSRW